MRGDIQSIFFFLLSRASLLFFLRDDPSLFLCAAEYSKGRSGFPKRSLLNRERERERDKRMMWFPISPKTREKEREDQRFEFTPRTKRSAKERKKKTNRQPVKHIKERERLLKRKRERKRQCFF